MDPFALPVRATRELARLTRGKPADYPVDGKVVLITGGGDGIGRALAGELHGRGARVAVLDVRAEAADTAAAALSGTLPLAADVRDRPAMADVVDKVVAHFGTLDVVVANAGVTPPLATLRTVDPDAFDRVIDVNLTGVFNTVRPALEQVIANRGHVVVVASCAAFSPGFGAAAYMISKAGVEQLGRALRLELAPHGASATTAYFGFVETRLAHATLDEDPLGRQVEAKMPAPLRRRISAEEAARVIADGIQRRAASTIAPTVWQTWALGRGVINGALDHYLGTDHGLHDLIRQIEDRSRRPA
jgi:NAD(P)-dependent dehydrogenase (short-subunit alcohol dehydrogenase family)